MTSKLVAMDRYALELVQWEDGEGKGKIVFTDIDFIEGASRKRHVSAGAWFAFLKLEDGTFEPLGRIEGDTGSTMIGALIARMMKRLVLKREDAL